MRLTSVFTLHPEHAVSPLVLEDINIIQKVSKTTYYYENAFFSITRGLRKPAHCVVSSSYGDTTESPLLRVSGRPQRPSCVRRWKGWSVHQPTGGIS